MGSAIISDRPISLFHKADFPLSNIKGPTTRFRVSKGPPGIVSTLHTMGHYGVPGLSDASRSLHM